jgi:hypothetical protein
VSDASWSSRLALCGGTADPNFSSLKDGILGFSVYTLAYTVPKLRDPVRQRLAIYVWTGVLLAMASVLFRVFHTKQPGCAFVRFASFAVRSSCSTLSLRTQIRSASSRRPFVGMQKQKGVIPRDGQEFGGNTRLRTEHTGSLIAPSAPPYACGSEDISRSSILAQIRAYAMEENLALSPPSASGRPGLAQLRHAALATREPGYSKLDKADRLCEVYNSARGYLRASPAVPGFFTRSLETTPLDRDLSTAASRDSSDCTSIADTNKKSLGGRSQAYRLVTFAVADATVASGAQERHREVWFSGTRTLRGIRSVLHTLSQCCRWICPSASGRIATGKLDGGTSDERACSAASLARRTSSKVELAADEACSHSPRLSRYPRLRLARWPTTLRNRLDCKTSPSALLSAPIPRRRARPSLRPTRLRPAFMPRSSRCRPGMPTTIRSRPKRPTTDPEPISMQRGTLTSRTGTACSMRFSENSASRRASRRWHPPVRARTLT